MKPSIRIIPIGEQNITIDDIWRIAEEKANVKLTEKARKRIKKSRKVIENIIKEGKIIYGITTGFGALKNKSISKNNLEQLQVNLIKSHSVGVGNFYSKKEARVIMFSRIASLAHGYSGVRLELLEKMIELLNNDIIPCIPSQGSVGCSGDLAPLSHMALALIGKGEVFYKNRIIPTKKVFGSLGIKPIKLKEKEGLALNNGTAVMTAIAALNLKRAINLIKTADMAGAISLEVMLGSLTAFDENIQKIRPHKGQSIVSKNFKSLCKESELMRSHKYCERVQDSYSLRCIPQVHGAVRDAVDYCRLVIETEINSTTDNPLVFSKEVKSGGNFHGEPIALVMDFLVIALSVLGNISERRIFKMLTPPLNEGLPPFLIAGKQAGLNSGLMMVQYTAASLVAENKIYSHPASVDSIPTCANQEDHVSFGTIAANKCKKVVENIENILAIELLCGTQAADLRKPLQLGRGTQIIYEKIRKDVKIIKQDRELHKDIDKIRKLITEDILLKELTKKNIKIL